jgi:ABC-2 type transport system ATP-binding protein
MGLPPAIECIGITKHYRDFQLRNIDLCFDQGSVLGLVGPNGAGKSTILKIISGLIEPDAGSLKVLGQSMYENPASAKRNIGFVAEDMRLYESETIAFHMNFIKSIFDSWDEEYAKNLLRHFDLKKEQKVKGLSHGQRVKTILLLTLARRPNLLVFDEPTTGLDPVARKEVLNEMMHALADETHSIIFSSHNTLDVEQISDHIAFIYDGRILESDDKENFIDSWRRLRISNINNQPLPKLPNIIDIQESGRICNLIVNKYDHSMTDIFSSAGLHINHVDRLTLEEIFVTKVSHAKANHNQEQPE